MGFNPKRFVLFCFSTFLITLIIPLAAYANKASVRIEAPDQAPIGSTITIRLHVYHNGDNFIHHVNWVYIKINDKELKRWDFGMFSTPESENFIREVTYTIKAPIKISVEANCNIHGSEGIAEKAVSVP